MIAEMDPSRKQSSVTPIQGLSQRQVAGDAERRADATRPRRRGVAKGAEAAWTARGEDAAGALVAARENPFQTTFAKSKRGLEQISQNVVWNKFPLEQISPVPAHLEQISLEQISPSSLLLAGLYRRTWNKFLATSEAGVAPACRSET